MRRSPFVVAFAGLGLAVAGGVAYLVTDGNEARPGQAPVVVATPRPPVLDALPDIRVPATLAFSSA